MRYKIEGESQTTHLPVTVIVDADSTLGARTQAADMGIDIVTLGVVDDQDYSNQKPMPVHSAVSHRSTTTMMLIVLVAVFAIMVLGGAAAFLFLAVDASPTQVNMPVQAYPTKKSSVDLLESVDTPNITVTDHVELRDPDAVRPVEIDPGEPTDSP